MWRRGKRRSPAAHTFSLKVSLRFNPGFELLAETLMLELGSVAVVGVAVAFVEAAASAELVGGLDAVPEPGAASDAAAGAASEGEEASPVPAMAPAA